VQLRARQVLSSIVEHVDVLVGNEEDLQAGLGIPGPAVAQTALDPSAFVAMIDAVVKRFPRIRIVATTLREVQSACRHRWGAVAWIGGDTYLSPTCELDVHDRVGGGDGFAAGFIYGLLTGEPAERAVNLGWAHGALLTTYPGDTTDGDARGSAGTCRRHRPREFNVNAKRTLRPTRGYGLTTAVRPERSTSRPETHVAPPDTRTAPPDRQNRST
jgi:sugar/nucleoside kinase (ribokinase family)